MEPIRASAPGRAGIVGNPSDIYGGFVLSGAVALRNRCALRLGVSGAPPADPRLWDAARARFPLVGDASVVWSSEVPRSSGLSGSTALLAASLLCVLEARGEAPDLAGAAGRVAFAELVRDVERNEAGVMCGYQDAYMIVHGGVQAMDFAGKSPSRSGPPARLSAMEGPLPFLLATTGIERLSGSVHGPMSERWLAGERAVLDGMARIAELGRAGAAAYGRGDWDGLAAAMRENARVVTELGGSGPPVERLIGACEANGARAAKLAGAGLGGTVIALTDAPDELEARLRGLGYARFSRLERQPGARLESGRGVSGSKVSSR